MKKKNENITDSFLLKYLKGETSSEETNTILDWIKRDPLNKERLSEISKIWDMSLSLSEFDKIDIQDDWKNVHEKILDTKNLVRKVPLIRTKIYRYGRIAASILIILSVSLYILYSADMLIIFQPVLTLNTTTEKSTVTLHDDTRVYLNENSTLTYPKRFLKQTRNIAVSGEAFFEVAKDENKPFYVSADGAIIKVLGTSFNVKAYPSAEVVIVSVLEGKVALYPKEKEEEAIQLNQYEEGVFGSDSLSKSGFGDLNFLSWKTRKLIFNKAPIEEVIVSLERYYKKTIYLESVGNRMPMVTSVFDDQPFNEVLDELEILLNISYRMRNDTVFIRLE